MPLPTGNLFNESGIIKKEYININHSQILGENPSYTKLESDDKYVPKATGKKSCR